MLKKYALKVSNTLSTINHMRPKSNSSRSSTSEEDGVTCTCDCDYNLVEVNRDLFIENYLIGRGASKTRSSSLSCADEVDATLRRNNNRRKSFTEKRDRLKINRNHLFGDKADKADRATTRHKISIDICDDYYDAEEERSRGCDFMESSAPTLKKVNNNLREFGDVELSIEFLPAENLHLNGKEPLELGWQFVKLVSRDDVSQSH